ncbi:aminopeptidase [uncultured Flavobacterium sp.]|uniref:aminopeptidase n=1 Tax=uncultured Flavobacterium sp. TaxID=165435 RepID=UPI0025EDCD8A|nr:aminopeptidase [uncultured Flavobacterium sp.]
MNATISYEEKSVFVLQEITFYNQSGDTLSSIVLNDWNNAYSDKNTPLADRFSDEFVRSFHLADDSERGKTENITILDQEDSFLKWHRFEKHPDVIEVNLARKIAPYEKATLKLTYVVKIPKDRFTKYGWDDNGNMNLKNWYLTPARFENHEFVKYSNYNLDDISNGIADFEVSLKIPSNSQITSDLNEISVSQKDSTAIYELSGKSRTDFTLFFEPKTTFYSYKNSVVNVETNLRETRLNDIQKALIIDKIVNYVHENIGKYPHEKITVSQTDYERSPFYGLNQLPAFISPFTDDFLFEIKFLKTYLNNYLKTSLRLNPRDDNWIYDGIQIYTMMKYIDEFHPESKMMGSVSQWWLLRSYNLTTIKFNEQYSYFYMLMARKNLDQPLGDPKNTLIKFNEQIASKYRAGLSLKYLDNYLENDVVKKSINEFYAMNSQKLTTRNDFENTLKSNARKDINWFFKTIIDSRDIIDYKFTQFSKTKDSVTFTVRNKTDVTVPIPVYGVKNDQVVFKEWLEKINTDSTFTLPRKDADKIVLNYENEVPEYNLRNNWKSLGGFFSQNRPIKFNFMKDLEDPYYNQILYVPTITYNFYDGISPGIRFHNKTILDKPFVFDINPIYSVKTESLTGSLSFVINQYNRDSNLYNVRYFFSSSYFHYEPDAAYLRLNPSVVLQIRERNFRDNRKQSIVFRQVIVHRDETIYETDEKQNYSVFNARYTNTKTELTNHFNFNTDLQLSSQFGKFATEISYRKLHEDNRQLNLRLYAGTFLYNKSKDDYFSFALDRPTDYLFDYNYLGRSENTGIYSQQYIIAEGGFKSKLDEPFASQWMTTFNAGYSIWNWVEAYGDIGFLKSKYNSPDFVYDSGIRLNLVQDYFELYFPVYSNNGWEIAQPNYNEKIRFIITLSPKTLTNLFTRKWL